MHMNWYQAQSNVTAIYPGSEPVEPGRVRGPGVVYNALALAGEAGEIAGKVSKIMRDHGGVFPDGMREELLKEAGDTLWHLTQLVDCLDGTLDEVARANLDKLADRQARGVIGGSGDNR